MALKAAYPGMKLSEPMYVREIEAPPVSYNSQFKV